MDNKEREKRIKKHIEKMKELASGIDTDKLCKELREDLFPPKVVVHRVLETFRKSFIKTLKIECLEFVSRKELAPIDKINYIKNKFEEQLKSLPPAGVSGRLLEKIEEIVINIWREYETDKWGDKYFIIEEDDYNKLKSLIQQLKEK